MMQTKYHGELVDTQPIWTSEDPNLLCINDECPGLEVEKDEDDGSVVEVRRIAWHSRYVKPRMYHRPEPGYFVNQSCPACGMDEAETL